MPRAVVAKTTETFQLTTCPGMSYETGITEESGWVELRRMSYGEKLRKDAEAMKMRFDVSGVGSSSNGKSDVNAEVALINEYVTLREFATCIVDHNLLDGNGQKLDFRKSEHVQSLDPKIGDEISQLIGEMNDFQRQATTSSTDAAGK